MSGRDRRDILPLLLGKFPELEGMSSDEVAAYLDSQTSVQTDLLEKNGAVFDTWRRALAKAGYEGVWPYTEEQVKVMAAKAEDLKADMARYRLRTTAPSAPLGAPTEGARAERRKELEAIAAKNGYKPSWVEHVLVAEDAKVGRR